MIVSSQSGFLTSMIAITNVVMIAPLQNLITNYSFDRTI